MDIKPEGGLGVQGLPPLGVLGQGLEIDQQELCLVHLDPAMSPDNHCQIADGHQRGGNVISDIVFSADVGIGHKQQAAQKDQADGALQEGIVELLHIIVDDGAVHGGFGQVVGVTHGSVQAVVQIRHDTQGIYENQRAGQNCQQAQDFLQFHLFFHL